MDFIFCFSLIQVHCEEQPFIRECELKSQLLCCPGFVFVILFLSFSHCSLLSRAWRLFPCGGSCAGLPFFLMKELFWLPMEVVVVFLSSLTLPFFFFFFEGMGSLILRENPRNAKMWWFLS